MALKCTSRRMSGGNGHEHIVALGWVQDGPGQSGMMSIHEMVAYIDRNGNSAVWCPDQTGGPSAWVHVNSNGVQRYVQTFADGRWTNNLLALPLA